MTEDDLKFTEIEAQTYGVNNCKFSAGFVEGHAVDTVYFKLEKDGGDPACFIMRPDEMQALAHCMIGTVWSHLNSLTDKDGE